MKTTGLAFFFLIILSGNAYSCNNEYVYTMYSIIQEQRSKLDSIVTKKMPNSIVLAQAILETGYGKSRAARIQNNHFGMSSQNGIMTYDSVEQNVEAYFDNLSNHNAYNNLRNILEQDEDNLQTIINSYASYYAEDPHYSNKVLRVINSCELTYYDRSNSLYALN